MNMILHETWREIVDWTGRMSAKYGGTVHDKNGQWWDWGQALCRDVYGADWMNDPDFQRVNEIPPEEPAPPEALDAMRRWEAGTVPGWVKEIT
jgi:hypothetical protein